MTAASRLLGLALVDGWTVTDQLFPLANATGGTFSHSYLAKKGGSVAFVKAFDFSDAFGPGVDTLRELNLLTSSYENERDILEHCRVKKLSHVATAISHGSVQVPALGPMEGRVYYLIFERADGDIRCQMDDASKTDLVWCMRALRDACLGLAQVHREQIAHQDVKPSNVLSFEQERAFRISDFGRSSRRGNSIWHDDTKFPGDRTYAPPELLYGYVVPDFRMRRIGTDLYMLGNLAAFLFSGINVTSSILARLDEAHHWRNWNYEYQDVLPYLKEAFGRVLEDLEPRFPQDVRQDVMTIVQDLCNPELEKRGHRKAVGKGDQYSLERYISRLTNLVYQLEIKARLARKIA